MTDLGYSERAVGGLKTPYTTPGNAIIKRLDSIKDFPCHYLTRLIGQPYYRLRVGDYRVIIDWTRNDDELFVREIPHREGAYD